MRAFAGMDRRQSVVSASGKRSYSVRSSYALCGTSMTASVESGGAYAQFLA